jgi:hypothetical protein
MTGLNISDKTVMYRSRVDMYEVMKIGGLEVGISPEEMQQRRLVKRFGSVESFIDYWGKNRVFGLHTQQNCTTPSTRRIIDQGYDLLHQMYGTEGDVLFQFRASQNDCV